MSVADKLIVDTVEQQENYSPLGFPQRFQQNHRMQIYAHRRVALHPQFFERYRVHNLCPFYPN